MMVDYIDPIGSETPEAQTGEVGAPESMIEQCLRAAGIDLSLLTPLDQGKVARALAADNRLIEGHGSLMAVAYHTEGLEKAIAPEAQDRRVDETEAQYLDRLAQEKAEGMETFAAVSTLQVPDDWRALVAAMADNMGVFIMEVEATDHKDLFARGAPQGADPLFMARKEQALRSLPGA